MHIAAEGGNKEIVKLLLARNADVDAKGHWNETPLHVTLDKGHEQVWEILRKHGGIEWLNSSALLDMLLTGQYPANPACHIALGLWKIEGRSLLDSLSEGCPIFF